MDGNRKRLDVFLMCMGIILNIINDIIYWRAYINYTVHAVINIINIIFMGYCLYRYYKNTRK